MNENDSIQSAVNDLSIIRRAIQKAAGGDPSIPAHSTAMDAGFIIQGLCLVIAVGLLAFELISGREMTEIMMLSARDQELGWLGLAQVALVGLALLMCVYFLAWRAARHSGQSFNDYLVRNFQYLRNLSFVSDLLVKFIPLSFVVLAGRPEWVAPLLSLYIADYLFQGRFFTLSTRVSLVLGGASLIAAAAQYFGHSAQLVWPLLHFAVISTASLIHLLGARRDALHAARAV